MRLEFGYYPWDYDKTFGAFSIATLPDLDRKVARVKESEWVADGWHYAPHKSRVFAMPKTHVIVHPNATSPEHTQFLLWCFGFFTGMRMSWTEAGFLDATPVERGAMIDIVWIEHGLDRAVAGADAFWHSYASDPRIAKTLSGVIHSYFLAQTRGLLPFEEFIYLYTAFDGCFRIHELQHPRPKGKRVLHAERIKRLCCAYGIVADSAGSTVPHWADPGTATNVAGVRNATLHEGLFFDEPLGFQGFGGGTLSGHVPFEMCRLLSRLVVAILELPAPAYVRSSITGRSREGVKL